MSKAGTKDKRWILYGGAETTGFTTMSDVNNINMSETYSFSAGIGRRIEAYTRNNRFSCKNTILTIATTPDIGNIVVGRERSKYKRYGTNQDERMLHLGWYWDWPFYLGFANGFNNVMDNGLSLSSDLYVAPLRLDIAPLGGLIDVYLSAGASANGSIFCHRINDITNNILDIPAEAYGYNYGLGLEARPGVRLSLLNHHVDLKGELHVFMPYDIEETITCSEQLLLNGRVSRNIVF